MQQDITQAGLTRADVRECLLNLLSRGRGRPYSGFDKTMSSDKRPGTMMDVYNRRFKGKLWYIKIVINYDRPDGGMQVVVTSFKEK